MQRYAIIVAGGTGTRMQSAIPKQFLLLHGKPIIIYVIEKFLAAQAQIIVVVNSEWLTYLQELLLNYQLTNIVCTNGGDTRSASVRNGLQCIDNHDSLVAIHDAARPMVSISVIAKSYDMANQYGNAVPVIPITDSLRHITTTHNVAVKRHEYFAVQTPQSFRTELIKKAFDNIENKHYTDEASLLENAGYKIHTFDGSVDNIKITNPADVIIAEQIMSTWTL